MRRKYYYLILGVVATLLFSVTVNATTSYISVNVPVQNSSNIQMLGTTYPNLVGELIDADDIQGTSQSWYKYEPNFAIDLSNMPSGFVTGYIFADISITTGLTNASYSNWQVTNTINSDSMHSAITWARNNTFRIVIYLDNYNTTSGSAHVGDLKLTYIDKETAYSATASTSFTSSITVSNSSLVKSDVVVNDRLTALLYSSITQATGQQLANIISGLQAIQNQDYVYYSQLVSGINQLHTDNNTLHSDLLSILNEIDLDFQQVQTILDLFPSYRTQVLQYWQDLLQMNATQSSAAAEIESQYAERESQSSQLINGMGSVVMPSISSNDLDILGTVDTTQKANFFGIIALITHNELVTKIMLIIVLGAIVGYILYGKK